jgi:hypothetical protein
VDHTDILDFVAAQKRHFATDGIVICGSYAQGRYGAGSDIDIVFLTRAEQAVVAQHITYKGIVFHRLLANAAQLWQFVVTATEDPFAIAVLHSLSAQVQIVEDSAALGELLRQAQSLVSERGIQYDPQEPEAVILHQQRYRITKVGGQWRLRVEGRDDQGCDRRTA